jgi:uncharacterized protein YidB (DUF937 family)
MVQMVIPTRLRLLAGAAVLVGGLGAAAVNGVFAAPLGNTNTGTVAAANTPVPGTPGPANPAGPNPQGRPGPGRFGGGGFVNQALADFFGMSLTDLRTAVQSHQTLAQIAQAHGKSTADLKTFLANQEKTRLDAAVQAGKLTAQQETTILNGQSARLDKLINGTFPGRGPRGPRGARGIGGFGFGLGGNLMNQVATFLGISRSDLQTALHNGQTLAQIAQAHGKSQADLKAFIVNQESSVIDKLITTNFQQARAQHRPGGPNPAAPSTSVTATPTP